VVAPPPAVWGKIGLWREKMEKANFKLLILIFAILVGLFVWRVGGEKILPKESGYFQKLGIKKEAVRVISLTRQGKSLELKKEDNVWRVNGKKAKEVQVTDLLAVLFPGGEPPLVAKTSARHSQMEVDEGQAVKIKINGEKEVWLGGGKYLRFPGSEEVWLVSQGAFTPTVDFSYWADKTIISLDSSKLKKIDWRSPPRIRVYEKKDNPPIVSALSPLTAEEVVEEQRPFGYSSVPKATLGIEWEGGSEKLEFFAGKDKYLVKRNSDGQEFLISSETAKKFLEL
jgi:hypothetical protein